MTSILDLKNPKNHKKNNNHSFSDILDGDLPVELETEPVPIEPTKKHNSKKKENFFKSPPDIDNEGIVPNNAGDMAPLATLTSTAIPGFAREPSTSLAWTASDKHHELIDHALRKWLIVVLVAVGFGAFFWQGSILTAITFFALALATSLHFWREAVRHQYEIHSHGITVGSQFYHYHDLDSFWIHYHPEGYNELSLCTGKILNHYIKVSLKGQDPFKVRDALAMYLPEERHEQGLEDWLRRKLGL